MPILNILRYPDARLHKVAAPVTVFDENLKKLVADMAETMYAAPGIGLAATQVDVHKQIIVVDVSAERGGWLLVQRLKRDPGTRNIPVVALVAVVGVETLEHARREGCVAVCLATCPPPALAAGLRGVLERAGRTATSARP